MYTLILDKCLKQDLIEIDDNLNNWEWDYRLGEKPKNWDDIPDYILNNHHNFPTKYGTINPITSYIKQKVSRKEILKYHHLKNCNMTRMQHEIWWIKNQISKFFHIGFYSKKNKKIMSNILGEIANKDKEEWIHKIYGN